MARVKLTMELAKEKLGQIQQVEHDHERAHILEDDLYSWFVESCAIGHYEDATEVYLVAQILKLTKKLKFTRHCS